MDSAGAFRLVCAAKSSSMHTARLIVLFLVLFVTHPVHAEVQLGTVVGTFPYAPSKILADPVRLRVYVADTNTNSVIVLDTASLKVLASIPTGSGPADMAISEDGTTLYVANSGSSLTAVGVVDLGSLRLKTSFSLPGPAKAIAAGAGGRVYVAAVIGDDDSEICQLDGSTGVVQTTFNSGLYVNDLLQTSPNGNTLFAGDTGSEPSTVMSFDVSTPTPSLRQTNDEAGIFTLQLVVSHNGKFLCVPCSGGNPVSGGYLTYLFSTANISATYGEFSNGIYPGPLAFSPNDALIYQTVGAEVASENTLQVFNTHTFEQVTQASFPIAGSGDYGDTITSIITDNTGSYLFVGESAMEATAAGSPYYVGQMLVLGTGVGPLPPTPPLVDVAATVPKAVFGRVKPGEFTITLATEAIVPFKVLYKLAGTAVDGTNYVAIGRSAEFQPGEKSQVIDIVPKGAAASASGRTVKLTILPGSGYAVGGQAEAKVTIE